MVPLQLFILLLGDILILLLVTITGFATHGEIESGWWRMVSTFIPLLVAWLFVAPVLQSFKLEFTKQAKQLWRPFYAMVLAAPLAAWIRGMWLGRAIIPIFVLALGGFSALAILAWRSLYLLFSRRGE
jgi:hypothetical protein